MTDLEKFKSCWDELGIRYHELVNNGYTYISKMRAHDEVGKVMLNFRLTDLTKPEQLRDFFEFDEVGDLVSW